MQVFERDSITLTVFSSKRWDIHNDNIDIEVTLNDGRRFAKVKRCQVPFLQRR